MKDEPSADVSLAGAWLLNEDLSDDPSQAMDQMRGGGPGADGGGPAARPGGFGGRDGGGRMGGRRGGRPSEDPQELRELLRSATTPPSRLTITQTDDAVTFTEPDGRTATFTINGKTERHQFDNHVVETRTKWKGGQLVKEIRLPHGLKIVETYSLAHESRMLQVNVKVEGSRMPRSISLRRFYDAVDPLGR